jgi:PAS domain S-box-containing protein
MDTVGSAWLLPFSRVLAGEDAAGCVLAALELLGEIGISARSGDDAGAWLTVRHGDEALALDAASPRPDAATTELLGNLLRAALARRAEQREQTRMRERMEMLSAASFEGLMFHVDRVIVDANRRLAEMVGYDAAELLGAATFERCVAEEDKAFLRARVAAREEGAYVITAIRKDGSRFRA